MLEKPHSHVSILVVDDDETGRFALQTLLEGEGYRVLAAEDGARAFAQAEEHTPDLIVSDVQMPSMGGHELTRAIRHHPALRYTPVLLITAAYGNEVLTEGFEAGADDFVRKPFDREDLLARIRAALRTRALYSELREREVANESLRQAFAEQFSCKSIIGRSEAMQRVYSVLQKITDSDLPVLIHGETGTGKELVAQALHHQSVRKHKPFITANCAALTEQLLESELFGHIKGSFTGAVRDKTGLFEAADGGTLFLDEVGEMSAVMQAKLLRVLQDGSFTPVGATRARTVKVRVIAATHRDLQQMVRAGTFREDLFYRLHVLTVEVPPLRDRVGDVELLTAFFLKKAAGDSSPKRLEAAVEQALAKYRWPGNVRELQNEIQRMVVLAGDAPVLTGDLLSPRVAGESPRSAEVSIAPPAPDAGALSLPLGLTLPKSIELLERQLIAEALRRTDGNKSETARLLDISRSSLISKVQSYGLETDDER